MLYSDFKDGCADYIWTYPGNYGGFSPEGDIIVCGRNRDSDILSESNYARIMEELEKFEADKLPEAPDNAEIESGDVGTFVYDYRAGHWACGWVETLLIRQDSPEELIDRVYEIIGALENYPIYDESDYSERQHNAVYDYWERCNTNERIEYCSECNVSIFAARRGDEIPDDVYTQLEQSESFY